MRFLVVSLVVLTVALGLVSSQQQGQELTPRQKQLLLERRQQLLLQQRKLEQSKKVPVGGPTKPSTTEIAFTGDIKLIPESQKITDIRNEDFDKFLANEESVAVLVNCFLSIQTCPHPSIVNMLKQVRTLGVGAKCETCTQQEQEDLNGKLYRFIYIFQNKYKSYWRQLLPHLGFILGTNTNRVDRRS